ncbi:hypothetical protein CRENBAI_006940, partial [Crenichthys baileyi]
IQKQAWGALRQTQRRLEATVRGEEPGEPGETTQQPQCRSLRELQRRAHRPRRQPTTREQIIQRGPSNPRPPTNRGLTEPGSSGTCEAPTRTEPAHTRAPSPGHRKPPTHQWAEAPATGRECTDTPEGPPVDPGGGPLHSGVETGRRPEPSVQTWARYCPYMNNPSPNPPPRPRYPHDPLPNLKTGPKKKRRSTWSKHASQPEPPVDETVPTPSIFTLLSPNP